MVRNVLTSWLGHFIVIAAGFAVTAVLYRKLDSAVLGVWYFSWSLAAYFGLVQMGIGSSVDRYVARYRAAGDGDGINTVVNSVLATMLIMALGVLVLTVGTTWLLPVVWAGRLGAMAGEAQFVVLCLGVGVAISLASAPFGGLITGYHRWDIHNAILVVGRVLSVLGMIAVVLLGYRLRALAAVSLAGAALESVLRVIWARRTCPLLRIRRGFIRWFMIRDGFAFGVKSLIPRWSDLLVYQTTNVMIVSFLGPAALALFAPPMTLVRHVATLVYKFAFVLVPTASAMQSVQGRKDLQRLMVQATRYGLYIALPMLVTLVVLGGPLLRIWIGPERARGSVLAILAIGHLVLIGLSPAKSVLAGLNAHGRAGLAHLLAAGLACGGVIAVLAMGKGLNAVALAMAVPLTVAYGVLMPGYACRQVGMPVLRFVRRAALGPLLCNLPLLGCLVIGRALADAWQGWAAGALAGGAVLGALYLRYALPQRIRTRIVCNLGLRGT